MARKNEEEAEGVAQIHEVKRSRLLRIVDGLTEL